MLVDDCGVYSWVAGDKVRRVGARVKWFSRFRGLRDMAAGSFWARAFYRRQTMTWRRQSAKNALISLMLRKGAM